MELNTTIKLNKDELEEAIKEYLESKGFAIIENTITINFEQVDDDDENLFIAGVDVQVDELSFEDDDNPYDRSFDKQKAARLSSVRRAAKRGKRKNTFHCR